MVMRAEYTKADLLVYLSHLDMVRLIERALRRADIAVLYTEGFHPTAKITFSLPAPLGMPSYGEVFEAYLDEVVDAEDFVNRMNACLPKGCRITSAQALGEGEAKLSKCAMQATYEIALEGEMPEEILARVMAEEECPVVKKNKKGRDVEVDIRDKIIALEKTPEGFSATLDASHSAVLSPTLLLEYLKNIYEDMPQIKQITKTRVAIKS